MPFTPFHLGLGALVKSVTPNKAFSFQVFLLSQVLIDIQPGLGLFLGWNELHGWHILMLAHCSLRWQPWRHG